jgi:hypothetical protein
MWYIMLKLILLVYVDELSSVRISQHKLFATLSAVVNINYRLLIKVHYLSCTVRHIKIEIQHNGQAKKDKRTSNDLQTIHIKLKIE